MSSPVEKLQRIKTLPQLVAYLRDELDWPIDADDVENVTFEYTPGELGLDKDADVGIKEIKQLRPLDQGQPWGVFFVNFEKKRLPVVVMRLILRALVLKKRTSATKADRQAWQPRDLLFISAYGDESDRAITFAHFVENTGSNLAELRVLGWDDDDTPLHMGYVAEMLQEKLRWDPKLAEKPDEWRQRWSDAFLIRHRHVIRTSAELAEHLARLARRLRSRIRTILRAERDSGEIRKLQQAFKATLIHDLDDEGFADMFAQTVTYGLFSLASRRTIAGAGTAFVKDDLSHYFTSPFLKEMLGIFLGIKSRKGAIDFDALGVSDVTDLLTSPDTHMEVVVADFNNKTQTEDPVIYFYEKFLPAYNKQLKIQRGVFYTPQPVVSYIVRSVHELLQSEFGLEDGLASTITWGEMVCTRPGLKLPPKTDEPGETRSVSPDEFFVEGSDVVPRHLQAKWDTGGLAAMPAIASPPKGTPAPRTFEDYWNVYVPKALLPRLHGYELMMAPYAIAHMKIGLKLSETKYRFAVEEPAQIYLTNALEPKVSQLPQIGFDALAHEAAAVNEIKWYKRFTVVIGNPPYTVMSANLSDEARSLVDPYRFVDGERLKEKSMLRLEMHLQDDYIKFFRIGQAFIEKAGCGVFGYVSNHSFLDNPTLRGMRQSLQSTFSNLWFYDLHGNSKKKDDAPEGTEDKNVFDIQQGVAISLAERLPSKSPQAVKHSDLFGSRDSKYRQLAPSAISGMTWGILEPSSPFHLFVPQDTTLRAEFEQAVGLLEIMPLNSCGVVSGREALTYDFDKSALEERITIFCDPKHSDDWVREKFEIRDAGGYELAKRRKMIVGKKANSFTRPIDVRPFDTRWVAFTRGVLTSDQSNVMAHMLGAPNIGLITTRQTKEAWGIFATRQLIAHKTVSAYDVSSLFPLHLQLDGETLKLSATTEPNLAPSFVRAFAGALGVRQKGAHGLPAGLTPEDIFHYAYAVFHSPGYRSRYAEFLKIDFPRLPLTGSLELFRALGRLGGEMVSLHLLESPKLAHPITECTGGRNPEVEKVSWSKNTVWVDKAQTTGFRGVRETVWNFHIGGYQVCEKWLKDRKGRTLSKDDIAHYHKIVVALTETIRLMAEIDKVIEKHGGWPGAFASSAISANENTGPAPAPAMPGGGSPPVDLGLRTEDELPLR